MTAIEFSFVLGAVVGVAGSFCLLIVWLLFRPWLKTVMCGAALHPICIMGMRLRGNPPALLIDAYLALQKSGQAITIDVVEACYIANKGKITDLDSLVNILPEYITRTDQVMKKQSSESREGTAP